MATNTEELTREQAKNLVYIGKGETYPYGIIDNVDEVIDKIFDYFENKKKKRKEKFGEKMKKIIVDFENGLVVPDFKVKDTVKELLASDCTEITIGSNILFDAIRLEIAEFYNDCSFEVFDKLTNTTHTYFNSKDMFGEKGFPKTLDSDLSCEIIKGIIKYRCVRY